VEACRKAPLAGALMQPNEISKQSGNIALIHIGHPQGVTLQKPQNFLLTILLIFNITTDAA
jgi:hypothetical protein